MTNWARRAFVRAFGLSGVAATAAPRFVTARGGEALAAGGALSAAIIHLNSNENPNGPGVMALNAIRNALPLGNRYPYEEAVRLTAAIARLHGVQTSQVIIGCGYAEILR